MAEKKDPSQPLDDFYAKKAAEGEPSTGSGGQAELVAHLQAIGYSDDEIRSVPQEAVMALGCGNPTALAELSPGETVLDLGSGGGLDAFLAARKVGPAGKVIGVDHTPEMVERARRSASRGNYPTVEFRLGEIESLPVEDDSVDVVLSNCVINHCPDLRAVPAEALRVLKPGGRMLVSDLVTLVAFSEDVRQALDPVWAEWLRAAHGRQEFLDAIAAAGFQHVAVCAERAFEYPGLDARLQGKIASIQVKARKAKSSG